MYALEAEPEKKGRWQRLGAGTIVCGVLAVSLAVAAQRITPVARALSSVIPIAVVEDIPEPPKKLDLPPPPPPPPVKAPPPKPQPKQEAAPELPPDAPPPPPSADPSPPQDQVGLDSDSFGSGGSGPGFAAGTSQMGIPGTKAGGGGIAPTPAPAVAKPKIVEARPLGNAGSVAYTERARRLGIQGLMVIETDVDEKGKVTRAVVRGKLEPQLDEQVRKAILGWAFQPATLEGKPVASTKFLRIRFELH